MISPKFQVPGNQQLLVVAGILVAQALLLLSLQTVAQEHTSNWPQFRGPGGAGIAHGDRRAPVEFSPDSKVLWKTDLPVGHSSPCIWKDRILVTGFRPDVKKLETICLDRQSGKILWRKDAPTDQLEKVHAISNPATQTPVTNGKAVFVYFGSYGLIAYDLDGAELWRKPMPMAVNPRGFGSGSSPILVGDHIILDMHLGADSHLLALRSQDGEPVWKTPKPRFNGGYSTPVVWREGADVVVGVLNSGRFTAYSAADGSERWWVTGLPVQTCATPVVADGMVYLNGTGALGEAENVHLPPTFDQAVAQYDSDKDGKVSSDEVPATLLFADRQSAGGAGDMTLRQALLFGSKEKSVTLDRAGWDKMVKDMTQFAQGALMKTSAVAVRCEGKGDVTATHVAWSQEKGVPEVPSPLLYRNRLYFVKNGGIVTCREPATGKTVFEQRLGAAGGYYASPVAADGRIYVASDEGAVTVFEAGDTLKVHARNDLREAIMATPAIIDGKLYIRTARQLFAFAE